MKSEKYQTIYQRACERKGSESALRALVPSPSEYGQLISPGDDRYLAELTRKVFQPGFAVKENCHGDTEARRKEKSFSSVSQCLRG